MGTLFKKWNADLIDRFRMQVGLESLHQLIGGRIHYKYCNNDCWQLPTFQIGLVCLYNDQYWFFLFRGKRPQIIDSVSSTARSLILNLILSRLKSFIWTTNINSILLILLSLKIYSYWDVAFFVHESEIEQFNFILSSHNKESKSPGGATC